MKNTRLLKESEHIILYRDRQDDLELAFKIPYDSLTNSVDSRCDLCGKHSKEYFFSPELGLNFICTNCFYQHRLSAKWYQEDMHIVFNMVIKFVFNTHLFLRDTIKFTDYDLDLIDLYFEAHSNHPISIRKFN